MQHAARELTAPGEFVAGGPAKAECPRRGAHIDHQGQSQQFGQGHPLAHLPSWPCSMGPSCSIRTGGASWLSDSSSSRCPPSCRKMVAAAFGSSSCLCKRGLPLDAVGDDVQEPLAVGHVVRVAGLDRFPGVPARVGCRKPERAGQPGPAGRRGGRPASCRTTCGRPEPGARRSRGIRGGGLCPCRLPGAGPAGRSWAGCRSGASSRRSASTARTAARRRAGRRARPGHRWQPGGSRRGAWSGTW